MKCKIVNSTLNGVRLTKLSDNNEVIVYTEAYVQELKHQLAEKDKEIETLRRALELACEDVGIVKVITKPVEIKDTNELQDYYIDQAKKEMDNE